MIRGQETGHVTSDLDIHVCPVCNQGSNLFKLCNVNNFDIFGCRTCGAEHVYPMPEAEVLKAYYDREQWFEGGEHGGYEDYEYQTAWSVSALKPLLEEFGGGSGLSILDVGCGYGAHLEMAANLGWKCFGVELSNHAREAAQKRLGGRAYVVESVADLIPHEFDVVLMLDVIEHLTDPYPLFYSLYSIGAITPKTRLIITTPNAGSTEALNNPAAWTYRHPPSHLVYYRAEALRFLLNKLQFTAIEVRGEHPILAGTREELSLADYGGLVVQAQGSNFTEFMRERYVPGTWSKIAEYEHLPRYELAKRVAVGKTVLDFGCGTGYGSAALAKVAARVTGLDIDQTAIAWAKETHHHPNLEFHRCDDLGASLAAASFDVVTCFEMIEHVGFEMQCATVASIARLLRPDGILVMSTPNPEVTGMYGENPYHLREMTREEFLQLLGAEFPQISILDQRVRHSVTFESNTVSNASALQPLGHGVGQTLPLAYIAFCSRHALPEVSPAVMFDETSDVIRDFLQQEQKMNVARFSAYGKAEQIENLTLANLQLNQEIERLGIGLSESNQTLEDYRNVLIAKAEELRKIQANAEQRELELQACQAENARLQELVSAITSANWHRLGVALRNKPLSGSGVRNIATLVAKLVLPKRAKKILRSYVSRSRQRQCVAIPNETGQIYMVKHPMPLLENRPRIVHVIANFCTGGSSRLVVDLMEYLGQYYEQSILTSHIPDPPAYGHIDIEEYRYPEDEKPFVAYLRSIKPALVHVHYWGDCDELWYVKAITAAEQLGIPVIENINTPVAPYYSPAVKRYVYVSDYVRKEFGRQDPSHVTVHPGSDFSLFSRRRDEVLAENCVGMVYRLESDKLNESAIMPFIRAVQKRPATKVLIVGGGSLLEGYRQAVAAAGLSANFEFTGYVSYASLPEYYRRMAVFVAPVWKESFGQVSPFAMSMKVPVCGYNVGAIGEIIGNDDLLAPAGDADRLADIIVRMLDQPEERSAIAEFQSQRANDLFSVQAMIQAYGDIYRNLTGIPA